MGFSRIVTEWNPKLRRRLIYVGFPILLVAIGIFVFFGIGRWLVIQDPLVHADAIVVLSGNVPERALEAARLYHAGYAVEIWISQPVSPAEKLKTMKISFVGEDFYNEKVLLAKGVPVDAIRILERPCLNTEAEVREIHEILRRNNSQNVIMVTSKAHTRRVRAVWNRLVGSDPHAIVRFANDDPYDGAHWWRHTQDGLDVVRESLGLLNAWAGFPLHRSQD
jgi:uncharacterized SAM-binding protein YcdF (DUF218 family)